jgi:uncharacterized protein
MAPSDQQSTVLVLAKAPVPGRVKTRLCPPCTPGQAAEVAEAALRDTFAAALGSVPHAPQSWRTIAVLDGEPGDWLPAGVEVIAQVGGGLGIRLDAAFREVLATNSARCVLIAMDTPHVTTEAISTALEKLSTHDCVIGPAEDGGYWLIGFNRYVPDAFENVTMSVDSTGSEQVTQLKALGLTVAIVAEMFDLDEASDVDRLAKQYPRLLTSQCWARFQ